MGSKEHNAPDAYQIFDWNQPFRHFPFQIIHYMGSSFDAFATVLVLFVFPVANFFTFELIFYRWHFFIYFINYIHLYDVFYAIFMHESWHNDKHLKNRRQRLHFIAVILLLWYKLPLNFHNKIVSMEVSVSFFQQLFNLLQNS